MSRLDPWRNGLDAPKGEDADRILQANFDEQAKFNDKIGLYLLGEAKTTTSQTVSSSTFTDAAGLKLSVTASGGLLLIFANVTLYGTNIDAKVRVMVGEKEAAIAYRNWAGTNVGQTIGLTTALQVPEGQTVIKVQVSSSGSVELQPSSLQSSIQVLEFLKG